MTVNRWQIEVRLPECKVGKGIIATNGMVADSDPSEEPKGKVYGFRSKEKCRKETTLENDSCSSKKIEENFVRLEDIIIVSK